MVHTLSFNSTRLPRISAVKAFPGLLMIHRGILAFMILSLMLHTSSRLRASEGGIVDTWL